MISQRCPKCKSSRIRRGYQQPPLILRLVGIYQLLCDNCNLLFRGFAVPGTVGTRTKKRKRRGSPGEEPESAHSADRVSHSS